MLTILYRACDKELESPPTRKGRPFWFSKLNCFRSLYDSYQKSKFKNQIKLIMLMDGDECVLSNEAKKLGCDIIFNKVGSNIGSLTYQLQYAEKIEQGNIYFLEDDYLHTHDAIDIIYSGIDKFDLITGYDHYDRYTRTDDVCYNKESIHYYAEKHWRTCESTTCTWAVSRKLISKIMPIANHFMLNDRDLFRFLYLNNIRLYSPITAVSTHVHEPYMSPGIDWKHINDKYS
jgi:hypothetical protein